VCWPLRGGRGTYVYTKTHKNIKEKFLTCHVLNHGLSISVHCSDIEGWQGAEPVVERHTPTVLEKGSPQQIFRNDGRKDDMIQIPLTRKRERKRV
jgi:hypothetical protein